MISRPFGPSRATAMLRAGSHADTSGAGAAVGETTSLRLHKHGVVLGAVFCGRIQRRLRASAVVAEIAEAAGRPRLAGLPAGFSKTSCDGLRRHAHTDAITTETRNTSTRGHAVARHSQQRPEEHGLCRIRQGTALHGEVARSIESRSRGGIWFLSSSAWK